MKGPKIIVIGGVASGPAAVAEARRTRSDAEITLIERGGDISYSACEMPMYISGEVANVSRLVRFTPEKFAERFSATVLTHHDVEAIDPERRKLSVRDFSSQALVELSFDKLILATGSRGVYPQNLQSASNDVHVIRSLEQSRSLTRQLEKREIHHAVIVGGGFVGLDTVESLVARGIRTTMLLSNGRFLQKSLDPEMSKLVAMHLESQGVLVRAERATALDIAPDGSIRAVETDAGEKIGCGLVLIAAGTKQNVELGKDAGLKIGITGGYEVDEQQRTSAPNIWACGDCTQKKDLTTGKAISAPLALNAFRSGRVAGRNAARSGRGRPAKLAPVVRAAGLKVFGLEIAHTGWSEEQAALAGLKAVAVTITHRSASSLAPHSDLSVRLVVEQVSRKLLGAQIVGEQGAAQRVNTVTALLRRNSTVDDLYEMDFVYAPRLSPAHDALMIAARSMQKLLSSRGGSTV